MPPPKSGCCDSSSGDSPLFVLPCMESVENSLLTTRFTPLNTFSWRKTLEDYSIYICFSLLNFLKDSTMEILLLSLHWCQGCAWRKICMPWCAQAAIFNLSLDKADFRFFGMLGTLLLRCPSASLPATLQACRKGTQMWFPNPLPCYSNSEWGLLCVTEMKEISI